MRGDEQPDTLDRDRAGGPFARDTLSRVFPQVPHLSGYATPETVWISTPPDQLGTGPEDHRIYVRDPMLDKEPYEYPYLPPFVGEIFRLRKRALTAISISFPRTRGSSCRRTPSPRSAACWISGKATLADRSSGTSPRRTSGSKSSPSSTGRTRSRAMAIWNSAASAAVDGRDYPYALNFDVIAHEVGHAILFSLFGTPASGLGRR